MSRVDTADMCSQQHWWLLSHIFVWPGGWKDKSAIWAITRALISLYPRVGEQRKLQIYFDCHERPDDITTIYKEQQLVAFNLIHSNVDELTVSFQQLGAESLNPSRYGDPNVCLPDLGGLEYAPWLRALYPFPQSMTLPRVFGHRDRVGWIDRWPCGNAASLTWALTIVCL